MLLFLVAMWLLSPCGEFCCMMTEASHLCWILLTFDAKLFSSGIRHDCLLPGNCTSGRIVLLPYNSHKKGMSFNYLDPNSLLWFPSPLFHHIFFVNLKLCNLVNCCSAIVFTSLLSPWSDSNHTTITTGYYDLWVCHCYANSKWTSWTISWWWRSAKPTIFTNKLCSDCCKWTKLCRHGFAIQRHLVYSSTNFHGPTGIYIVFCYVF